MIEPDTKLSITGVEKSGSPDKPEEITITLEDEGDLATNPKHYLYKYDPKENEYVFDHMSIGKTSAWTYDSNEVLNISGGKAAVEDYITNETGVEVRDHDEIAERINDETQIEVINTEKEFKNGDPREITITLVQGSIEENPKEFTFKRPTDGILASLFGTIRFRRLNMPQQNGGEWEWSQLEVETISIAYKIAEQHLE